MIKKTMLDKLNENERQVLEKIGHIILDAKLNKEELSTVHYVLTLYIIDNFRLCGNNLEMARDYLNLLKGEILNALVINNYN